MGAPCETPQKHAINYTQDWALGNSSASHWATVLELFCEADPNALELHNFHLCYCKSFQNQCRKKGVFASAVL